MKKSEGVAIKWLADCDFLNERFDSLAAAWADAAEYTREISPRMEAQQLRALKMVFYAAASGALKAAQNSRDYEQFEARMTAGWEVFVPACVLPCIRPRSLPVFSPEAVRNEMDAMIEHQHGYWQGGARAALLCLRAGCASAALEAEIDVARKEVVARHAAEGRTL
jgi:hypothetical protein